jgi:hypothetical protein
LLIGLVHLQFPNTHRFHGGQWAPGSHFYLEPVQKMRFHTAIVFDPLLTEQPAFTEGFFATDITAFPYERVFDCQCTCDAAQSGSEDGETGSGGQELGVNAEPEEGDTGARSLRRHGFATDVDTGLPLGPENHETTATFVGGASQYKPFIPFQSR